MGKLEIKYSYPAIEELEKADHEQVCKWYRFLNFASGKEEDRIMFKIVAKFKKGGGMTSTISKKIGWDK